MKLIEIKVIFEAENIEEVKNEIIDTLYEFGIQGVKIEEPMKRNPLDYYSDEKYFITNDYSVSAYFPNNFYAEKKKTMFKEKFLELFQERDDMLYSIDFYEYDEEDYQDAWKKYLYPEKISDKFVVKPTWREYEADADEIVIELDPGRAFGTGSHPTTYLCVQMMEKYIGDSDKVIDVGTGSGILMIVSEKLGASKIWGVDIDEAAVLAAKENLLLNNVPENKTEVFEGNLIDVVKEEKFDVVVANILADVILLLLNDISRVVKDNGIIILSGIINTKKSEVFAKLNNLGLEILEIKESKEWTSIVVKA